MAPVIVYITSAIICFSGECHPVLTGKLTPTGTYPIMHAKITSPGYGGDVLAFKKVEDSKYEEWFSVHRVWTAKPSERRINRLFGPPQDRMNITNGCINVLPDVYDKIVECCSKGTITIQK